MRSAQLVHGPYPPKSMAFGTVGLADSRHSDRNINVNPRLVLVDPRADDFTANSGSPIACTLICIICKLSSVSRVSTEASMGIGRPFTFVVTLNTTVSRVKYRPSRYRLRSDKEGVAHGMTFRLSGKSQHN